MRRRLLGLGLAAALAVPGGAAVAQTDDYPGSTTSTTSGPTEERRGVGIIIEGDGFTNEACLFLFPGTVTVEFNGQFVETDNVESDTCARQDIRIDQVGPTPGADFGTASARPVLAVAGLQLAQSRGQISLRIDGRPFSGQLDNNTLIVSGTGLNGQPRRVITTFSIRDKSFLGGARGGTDGGSGGGGAASPLARTGAAVISWAGAGVLLILLGVALQRTSKRRRRYSAL